MSRLEALSHFLQAALLVFVGLMIYAGVEPSTPFAVMFWILAAVHLYLTRTEYLS